MYQFFKNVNIELDRKKIHLRKKISKIHGPSQNSFGGGGRAKFSKIKNILQH